MYEIFCIVELYGDDKAMIRKVLFAILISSLLGVQSVLAIEYKLEFKAKASGMFVLIEGIPGGEGPPPVAAIGEGKAKLDGDAVVSQTGNGLYFDFPAEMKMGGKIKGQINMVEDVDGEWVITETYRLELEFWNLESAGGMFSPDEDVMIIAAEMDISQIPEVACLGYNLELENVENDEELKTSGEGYLLVAGLVQMGDASYEAFIMIIKIDGNLFTIIFSEQPEIESIVETKVKLSKF